jgi:hypothetical protein
MAELFASGSIVLWILALMLLEAAALVLLRARGRIRMPALDVLIALAAGAALMLALREALRHAPWQQISIWLGVALCAHVLDVARRLTAPPPARAGGTA